MPRESVSNVYPGGLAQYIQGIDCTKASLRKFSIKLLKIALAVSPGIFVALIPCPEKVTQNSWYVLAVFIATISISVVNIVPIGLASFVGLTFITFIGITTVQVALASFASPTVWIIVCAFLIAKSIRTTGLGRRIAYFLAMKIGTNPLGLGYSLVFSEMFIGAAMPSITARSGGIFYPVSRELCDVFRPEESNSGARTARFLMQLGNQAGCIVSAMFLTGMASNMVVASLAQQYGGVTITWSDWFWIAAVPGVVCLLVIPRVLFFLENPDFTNYEEISEKVRQNLHDMGSITLHELITLGVFFSALFMWIATDMHSTVVAMGAAAMLLSTGILKWDDVLGERSCWDCLIWVSALMQMASLIASGGSLVLFSEFISPLVQGIPWWLTFASISALYVFTQYFFAGLTPHIMALYAPFLVICVMAGTPPLLAAILLGAFSNVCGGLTHFAGAHTPIWFSSGFVDQNSWWRNGFICTAINIFIFLGVGAIWWKVLGIY